MAPRDTIIDVTDIQTGHTARLRVPYDLLQIALRDSSKDYLPSGLPVPRVQGARDHICIQAKAALAENGRRQSFLPWANIEASVRASDQVPARGTQPHAVRTPEPEAADHPVYPPTPLNHQGRLFTPSGMLI